MALYLRDGGFDFFLRWPRSIFVIFSRAVAEHHLVTCQMRLVTRACLFIEKG